MGSQSNASILPLDVVRLSTSSFRRRASSGLNAAGLFFSARATSGCSTYQSKNDCTKRLHDFSLSRCCFAWLYSEEADRSRRQRVSAGRFTMFRLTTRGLYASYGRLLDTHPGERRCGRALIQPLLSFRARLPAPMHPQPLLRIFPHIILNDLSELLRVGDDVRFQVAGPH